MDSWDKERILHHLDQTLKHRRWDEQCKKETITQALLSHDNDNDEAEEKCLELKGTHNGANHPVDVSFSKDAVKEFLINC